MNYPLAEFANFIEHDGRRCGLMIRCPNCGMKMSAWFKNPIGGGEGYGRVKWDRTGETLETLSLNPSFLAYEHYHSWIRDGQIQVDSAFSCKPIAPEDLA
jgi:hypothetical protein